MPKKPARLRDRRHILPEAFQLYFEQGVSSIAMSSTVEGFFDLFVLEADPDALERMREEYAEKAR